MADIRLTVDPLDVEEEGFHDPFGEVLDAADDKDPIRDLLGADDGAPKDAAAASAAAARDAALVRSATALSLDAAVLRLLSDTLKGGGEKAEAMRGVMPGLEKGVKDGYITKAQAEQILKGTPEAQQAWAKVLSDRSIDKAQLAALATATPEALKALSEAAKVLDKPAMQQLINAKLSDTSLGAVAEGLKNGALDKVSFTKYLALKPDVRGAFEQLLNQGINKENVDTVLRDNTPKQRMEAFSKGFENGSLDNASLKAILPVKDAADRANLDKILSSDKVSKRTVDALIHYGVQGPKLNDLAPMIAEGIVDNQTLGQLDRLKPQEQRDYVQQLREGFDTNERAKQEYQKIRGSLDPKTQEAYDRLIESRHLYGKELERAMQQEKELASKPAELANHHENMQRFADVAKDATPLRPDTLGIKGDGVSKGFEAERLAHEAFRQALEHKSGRGPSLAEQGWTVLKVKEGSFPDRASLDFVFYNKNTGEWMPMDVTLRDKGNKPFYMRLGEGNFDHKTGQPRDIGALSDRLARQLEQPENRFNTKDIKPPLSDAAAPESTSGRPLNEAEKRLAGLESWQQELKRQSEELRKSRDPSDADKARKLDKLRENFIDHAVTHAKQEAQLRATADKSSKSLLEGLIADADPQKTLDQAKLDQSTREMIRINDGEVTMHHDGRDYHIGRLDNIVDRALRDLDPTQVDKLADKLGVDKALPPDEKIEALRQKLMEKPNALLDRLGLDWKECADARFNEAKENYFRDETKRLRDPALQPKVTDADIRKFMEQGLKDALNHEGKIDRAKLETFLRDQYKKMLVERGVEPGEAQKMAAKLTVKEGAGDPKVSRKTGTTELSIDTSKSPIEVLKQSLAQLNRAEREITLAERARIPDTKKLDRPIRGNDAQSKAMEGLQEADRGFLERLNQSSDTVTQRDAGALARVERAAKVQKLTEKAAPFIKEAQSLGLDKAEAWNAVELQKNATVEQKAAFDAFVEVRRLWLAGDRETRGIVNKAVSGPASVAPVAEALGFETPKPETPVPKPGEGGASPPVVADITAPETLPKVGEGGPRVEINRQEGSGSVVRDRVGTPRVILELKELNADKLKELYDTCAKELKEELKKTDLDKSTREAYEAQLAQLEKLSKALEPGSPKRDAIFEAIRKGRQAELSKLPGHQHWAGKAVKVGGVVTSVGILICFGLAAIEEKGG